MLKKAYKFFAIVIIVAFLGIIISNCSNLYEKNVYPIKYSEYVEKYSQQYNVDPYLIYAVIKTESGFKPDVVSNVGATGLMQIMQESFDWIKFKKNEKNDIQYEDMNNPEYNIEYGTYLISILLDEYGDLYTAAAAYHAGRGQVNKWLTEHEYSNNGKQLDTIPSTTTSHYAKKIMNAYKNYQNIYKK